MDLLAANGSQHWGTMLRKESQQSLLEMLFMVMPELKEKLSIPSGAKTNNKAAQVLYNIWRNEKHQVSDNKFKTPSNLSNSDINLLESEGLVTSSGAHVIISKKGGEIIKQMILGDNRSVFDDDGETIEYMKAVANH